MKKNKDLSNFDHALVEYVQILTNEMKFKAKVLFTLNCINNCLAASGALYLSNIEYLSKQQKILTQIARIHCDGPVLSPISSLFSKFQEIGKKGIVTQFLNVIEQQSIQGDINHQLISNICHMLEIVSHQYPKIKEICMKILESCSSKLKDNQICLLLNVLSTTCILNKQQCCKLYQFPNISPVSTIQLLWISTISTKNDKLQKRSTNLQYQIINKCLEQQAGNEIVQYTSLKISLWNGTNSVGSIQKLIPDYLDCYYRNNVKPLWGGINKISSDKIEGILQHFANQYSFVQQQTLQKQFLDVIKQLSQYQQYVQMITNISKQQQLSPTIQLKYINILPIQFLSNPQAITKKLVLVASPANAFKTIMKLSTKQYNFIKNKQKISKIYLNILQIYLSNKQCQYLKIIQQIITHQLTSDKIFTIQLLTKYQQYCLFVPCTLNIIQNCNEKQREQIQGNIINYIGNQSRALSYKFYLCTGVIRIKYKKGITTFIQCLQRAFVKQSQVYQQLAYYIKTMEMKEDVLNWLTNNYQQQLQNILDKVFGRLANTGDNSCRQIVFSLQKYRIYDEWNPIYKLSLHLLDNIILQNSNILDNLQIFECIIQRCTHIPQQIIKKYFNIIGKNWQNYTHHHFNVIQRIANRLFQYQELNANQLEDINRYIKLLVHKQWKCNNNSDIYRASFGLMVKNTLMEQTEQMNKQLINICNRQIQKISKNASTQYQKLKIKLFAQELLLWRIQNEDDKLDDKVAQNLMKMLKQYEFYQFVNLKDLGYFVQNCLEIIATINHQCNLLELPLAHVMRNFIQNTQIISFTTFIIQNVKQHNLKALATFSLQKIIIQILSLLILNKDNKQNIAYINLLKQLCDDKNSPYNSLFPKNYQLFIQILRVQTIFIINYYRPEVITFVLQNLVLFNLSINVKFVQYIWVKYYRFEDIRKYCLMLCKQLDSGINVINMIEECKTKNLVAQKNQQSKDKEIKEKNKLINNLKEDNEKIQHNQQKVTNNIIHLEQPPKKQNQQLSEPKHEQNQKQNNVQQTNTKNATKKPTLQRVKFSLEIQANGEQVIKQPQIKMKSQKQLKKEKESDEEKDDKAFGITKPQKSTAISKTDEKQNKVKRTIQGQQQKQNISEIKGHITFINSVANCKLDQIQTNKLSQSLTDLIDAVSTHSYYCQRVVNLGAISKCLSLHPQTQKVVLIKMLQLFEQMSNIKQKNLTIFNDQKSISFFKRLLKQSINCKKQLSSNQYVINIIQKCWNASNQFFSLGLLSMLFQMAKLNLSRKRTLELLSTSPLSFQIVNEIYQRGLFKVMEEIFTIQNTQLSLRDKQEICYWTRLMGKICVNQSIRDKLYSTNFNKLTYKKISVYEEMNCVQNLAYFYSNFVCEYEKMGIWCVQEKIPEYFLRQMEKQEEIISQDYYKFYRNLSQNGKQYIDYLFRIKYHLHLISVLEGQKQRMQSEGFKYFCKSLQNLFVPDHYQIFIKSQVVHLLIARYKNNSTFYVIECIQKLVEQIREIGELNVLQRQGLYLINQVFKTKIKDDMSYPYVLVMYMKLFSKFKKFNNEFLNNEFAAIVIRKGLFSINMQGKRKVLQFLIQFSQIDKISYAYGPCYKIFQSLFNYNMNYDQLQLFYQFQLIQLKYDKISKQIQSNNKQNKTIVKNKIIIQLSNQIQLKTLIANKYIQLRIKLENKQDNLYKIKKQIDITIEILLLFFRMEFNAVSFFQKLRGNLLQIQSIYPYCFQSSIRLINQLIKFKPLTQNFRNLSNMLLNYLQKMSDYLNNPQQLTQKLLQQYSKLIDYCLRNNIIQKNGIQNFLAQRLKQSTYRNNKQIKQLLEVYKISKIDQQLSDIMKNNMKKGIKVKMFKIDGSSSGLILYFTADLFQLNCVICMGEPVKNKWKFPLNQLIQMVIYTNEQNYKLSPFYQSQGIFSKAPLMQNCMSLISKDKNKNFYICFQNVIGLKQWKKYIEIAKKRTKRVFLALQQ